MPMCWSIGHRKEIRKLTSGQFTLSTQLIKPIILLYSPPPLQHSFFRNLPPLCLYGPGSCVTRVFHVSSRPLCYDRVLISSQELNVRKITVSSDKHKFGVQLRAEPDNQTLGRRLKGAFKQVSQAIKGILYQAMMLIQVEYLVVFVGVIS